MAEESKLTLEFCVRRTAWRRLALFFFLFIRFSFGQQWSIGDWTPSGAPIQASAIPWDGLTHIVQGHVAIHSDGGLDLTSYAFAANAPDLVRSAHAANVKALVGLGGPGDTAAFSNAISDHESALITNIVNLVNEYGFDGVAIRSMPLDSAADRAAMTSLLTDLRAQLGTNILVADAGIADSVYWSTVAAQLDRINVQAYGIGGTLMSDYSWYNAALYGSGPGVSSADAVVQAFLSAGVPAGKITIAVPFYGIEWSGGGIGGPYEHFSKPPAVRRLDYSQIVPRINARNFRWDSAAQVPYLVGDLAIPTFVSYDDEQSVALKIDYAITMGLGGWNIREVSGDFLPSSDPQHPLMTAIRNAMRVAMAVTSLSVPATMGAPHPQPTPQIGIAPTTSPAVISQSSGSSGPKIRNASLGQTRPLIVTTAALTSAVTGGAYSQVLAASGKTPITWSVTSGVLPAGLNLNSSSGMISGAPSTAGRFAFTITATNAAGNNSKSVILAVMAPPAFFTYYVDSVNGADSNPGSLAAPWKTVAKVNSIRLLPGQSIAFKAGDIWREQLNVFGSGLAGSPITFTSYGNGPAPIISGADLLTSWTSTPPYRTNYKAAPTQVFRSGARLIQVSSQSALVTGTWWLDTAASQIYVYDNPSGSKMEASSRQYGIEINGNSNVTARGLSIVGAAKEGVGVFAGGQYVAIINCNISNSYNNGIALYGTGVSMNYGVIQNNTISGSGSSGINAEQYAAYWTIDSNTIFGNSALPANNAYMAGIQIGSSSVSNFTIQNNTVYANGLGQATNIGFGIHVDVESPNHIIRWNNANGNNDCNILVEISKYNQIYGNVVYGSIQGCGIGIRGAAGTPAVGNAVYNNTVYGNLSHGIWAGGLLAYGDGSAGSFAENVFENNVSVGNGSPQLNAFGGAENDGINGFGNVYAYNDFGPDVTNLIKWGSTGNYNSVAAWQATSKQGHNLDASPMFTNAAAGDFTLLSGSPAIKTGIYISGVSTTNPPNIGAK